MFGYAKEFLDAATRLQKPKPFLRHPTFYCVLHCIELSLKAHLAHAGFTRRKLASKAYGHNLAELLNAADANGSLHKASLAHLTARPSDLGPKITRRSPSNIQNSWSLRTRLENGCESHVSSYGALSL